MKLIYTLPFIIMSFAAIAQSDIDIVLLKNGTRFECEILELRNDSIFFSQFRGSHKIHRKFPMDETAIYILNNFYTTPGEELIKASRNLSFGAGIILMGGTLSYLGRKDDRQNLSDIGVGLAALGSVVCILGFNNFKKAGKKLNKIDYMGDRLIFKL
ncbi:MAG: hypothetical protein K9H16_16365 [Bacteroidales bacterium]|nr:hypothetical protein [Bacteroidales bacterium]